MCSSQTDFSMRKILGIDGNQAYSSGLDLAQNSRKRKRRTRTIFSPQALSILELAFSSNSYPDMYERTKLAGIIGEEEARVQVWFQNRRARAKRTRQAASNSPSTDVSSDSLSSSTSSGSSSFSPIQRPVHVIKADPDKYTSDLGPYYPFPYYYPASFLPTAGAIPRPFDVPSYHGDTLLGELKSPLWSPGSPTFSKLFEFPPKAHTPLRDARRRPGFPQQAHSDEVFSSRSSSVDSRQSGSDDVTNVSNSRTVQYSCVRDFRRSERRSDEEDSELVIGRIEDTSSDDEDVLVMDLSVRTPDSKIAACCHGDR
ncbi:homeobox protein prophet of Pit-1-like [Mizuhopecten yessoensis]|uniref:Dorsal root ganglia homeobox protein n=1 Tax=Mizuhopecten yessoensis TaxID=6573 RepID=A0A210R462_MIZYE|nr:homeobox protein prophet of Pit-1-like [Mizuhopecten yessoensis]OWF55799.1 Dorsal root ganglia homeobox protein [Mizuhopecten yessoensis]